MKVKRIRQIYLQIFFVFPDITKIVRFWWKAADTTRTPGMYKLFGSSLGKV